MKKHLMITHSKTVVKNYFEKFMNIAMNTHKKHDQSYKRKVEIIGIFKLHNFYR